MSRSLSRLHVEELEPRALPSVVPYYTGVHPDLSGGPTGFTPAQVRHAYGFDQVRFNNGTIVGDGKGQTIALVDAYDDPTISADLHQLDQKLGLPDPAFTKLNQSGGSKYPQTNATWALETALDVEWAHAIAPHATLVLVEANSSSWSDLLSAVDTARKWPGVSVVSLSWGDSEFPNETQLDPVFTTPPNHNNVTFVAASGDSGAPPQYPAVSPNVLAVGGTSLTIRSDGSWQSETGWSSSGGGQSAFESRPAFQTSLPMSHRGSPDVAYNADPNTGFAVFDSVPLDGQSGWMTVGGTSVAAPQWAALVAIANQGRWWSGAAPLDGTTQTLPALYNLPASDFHDVTTGNNGHAAGVGYDLVTGRGTPLANLVIPQLVAVTGSGSLPTPSHSTPTKGSVSSKAVPGSLLREGRTWLTKPRLGKQSRLTSITSTPQDFVLGDKL
jgi:subtilase family serine protease